MVLTIGISIYEIPQNASSYTQKSKTHLFGVLLGLVMAMISTIASLFMEKMLKKPDSMITSQVCAKDNDSNKSTTDQQIVLALLVWDLDLRVIVGQVDWSRVC